MIFLGLDKFTIFVTLLILIYIFRPKINRNKQRKNNIQQKFDKPPSKITILIAKGIIVTIILTASNILADYSESR